MESRPSESLRKILFVAVFIFLNITLGIRIANAQFTNIREVLEQEGACPLPPIEKVSGSEKPRAPRTNSMDLVPPWTPVPPPASPPPTTRPAPVAVTEEVSENLPAADDFWNSKGEISSKYSRLLKEYFQAIAYAPTIEYLDRTFFQDENYQWGIKSNAGEIILEPQYNYIKTNEDWNGFIAIKDLGDKFNFYNMAGQPLFASGYHSIRFVGDFLEVVTEEGVGVVDKQGKVLIPPIYKNGRAMISAGELYLIAESENKLLLLVTPNQEAKELPIRFRNGMQLIQGRYLYFKNRLIDVERNEYLLCDPSMTIGKVSGANDVFYLKREQFCYFFKASGELVAPNVSDRLVFFGGPFASLGVFGNLSNTETNSAAKKYGVINRNFEWLVPPVYQRTTVAHVKAGLFTALNNDNKWGIIDSLGNTVVPFEYGFLDCEGDVLFGYMGSKDSPGKVDVFDIAGNRKGTYTVSHHFLKIHPCGESYVVEGRQKSERKIVILNEQYEEIFTENIGTISKLGSKGFIVKSHSTGQEETVILDCEGQPYPFMIDDEIVTEFQFVDNLNAGDFVHLQTIAGKRYLYNLSEGKAYEIDADITNVSEQINQKLNLIKAAKGEKLGLVNFSGEELSPFTFDKIEGTFPQGVLKLTDGNNYTLLTWTGDLLFNEYDFFKYFRYNLFLAKKNGKSGLIDYEGNVLVPFNYRSILMKDYLIQTVDRNGTVSYYGIDGRVIN